MGQRIELPEGRYLSAVFLAAGSYGDASGKATVHYADGSTTTAPLGGSDWYSTGGSLVAPYRYGPDGTKDEHRVGIGSSELWLDPGATPSPSRFPVTHRPRRTRPRSTSSRFPPTGRPRKALALRNARVHDSLLEPADAQSVEATVVNAGTVPVLAADGVTVRVDVPGARTVDPPRVPRLDPGEQSRLRIGIRSRGHSRRHGPSRTAVSSSPDEEGRPPRAEQVHPRGRRLRAH